MMYVNITLHPGCSLNIAIELEILFNAQLNSMRLVKTLKMHWFIDIFRRYVLKLFWADWSFFTTYFEYNLKSVIYTRDANIS